jgi:hypothetical protein
VTSKMTKLQKEGSRRQERIAPSEQKAQALRALWQGQSDAQSGEEVLSTVVRLSTERVLQEVVEQEQAEALGRGR